MKRLVLVALGLYLLPFLANAQSVCPQYQQPLCQSGQHVEQGTTNPTTGCTSAPQCVADSTSAFTITLIQPGQPSGGGAYAGQTVAAVAITVRSTALAHISAIKVQKVGSTNNAAISSLQVNTDASTVVGTASGFDANNTATIPVSATVDTSNTKTFLVSAVMANNLTAYMGQSFEFNITAVTSDAVTTSGTLPVYGAQFTISTNAQKPTCSMSANTSTYTIGQTINIRWTSANATGGTITGIGNVGPEGLQGILPGGQSQTFVGTFTGPGGTGTCSLTLTLTTANGGTISSIDNGVGGGGSVTNPNGTFGSTNGGTVTPGAQTGSTGSVNTPTTPTAQGNIIPCSGLDCRPCDLAALAQNVINYLIGLTIPLAAVMFAWAGILYFTSATNPHNIDRAKAIFRVVFWGFLIAIGAWLMVQTILRFTLGSTYYQNWNVIQCTGAVRPGSTVNNSTNVSSFFNNIGGVNLGNPNAVALDTSGSVTGGGGNLSPGDYINQNFSGGSANCPSGYTYLADAQTCSNAEGTDFKEPTYSLANTLGKNGYAQCSDNNANCSIQTLLNAGLSQDQANAMSCIAITENSGNAAGCSGTGPCGTFQISKTNWKQYAPSECQASNFGGNITAAQNNGQCNLVTAVNMVQDQGYQPWTGNNNGVYWNKNARTCVNNYDPSNLR